MKITEINGNKAVVESGSHSHEVSIDLLRDARIGNFVLVHGDMAINKVSKEEAEKILEIIEH